MLRVAALVLIGIPLAAAPAYADNGGLTPVKPASENAQAIYDSYILILFVTGFVFVLVEATLVWFLVRYRRAARPREGEGPQVRGHTRIEVAWTIVPVMLLAIITAFVFVKLPEIEDAPAAGPADSIAITVEGHQFYWLYRYPGGEIAVDELVVPVNKVVTLEVVTPDVIHSWWIPALGGKIDAIPGRTNETWFKADREGTFTGRCAELCGAQHAYMTASVRAVSAAAFTQFLATHSESSETVGQETFEGVCAKCHGLAGEGSDGAPPIAGRPFDATTIALIRGGGATMPSVGEDWSDDHIDATIAYLNDSIGTP
jgi:cytochrome c oxidase subunit II